jgi:5-methylcytosine-specific restriction endonuclease McrA
MDKKQKDAFRRTKAWKDFRLSLIEKAQFSCQLCGTHYSGKAKRKLQVHHLYPEDYTNLDPNRFRVLCSEDHKLVERIACKFLAKNPKIENLEKWLSLLSDFLPNDAKVAGIKQMGSIKK